MDAFLRDPPGDPRSEYRVVNIVSRFTVEREVATVLRMQDPFGCDDVCPFNANGHGAIASCGQVVCPYCARIWS